MTSYQFLLNHFPTAFFNIIIPPTNLFNKKVKKYGKGHITVYFPHFPISFGSKNHISLEYRPCWTEERKDIFKNKKVVRLALLNASLLTPKWLNYDTQTALSEV